MVTPMIFVFLTYILIYAAVAIFYALIIYYAGVLFRIVCFKINDLDRRIDELDEEQKLEELKSIAIAHQKSIEIASKLENAIRYPMLVQVLINTFLICMIGFNIITVKMSLCNL